MKRIIPFFVLVILLGHHSVQAFYDAQNTLPSCDVECHHVHHEDGNVCAEIQPEKIKIPHYVYTVNHSVSNFVRTIDTADTFVVIQNQHYSRKPDLLHICPRSLIDDVA